MIAGLEQDFPPPRTGVSGRPTLPALLTPLIGREDVSAQVRQRLEANRLVTLTGTGGTGKTRLALEVARVADAAFVDLSAATAEDVVLRMIGESLGVHEQPGGSLLEDLQAHLLDQRLLLVLDNYEQVVATAADVIAPLLGASPGLSVLVTSRIPLRLYGEHVFPVPPLSVPDRGRRIDPAAVGRCEAVVLFVERARAVRPGFRLTADNAAVVAEITARLDGLPLAIELAASRLRLLAPAELLARLDPRLPLLSASGHQVPGRQGTVRRTIEWSHDLPQEPEQRLFRRLAVFAGAADLDAAEAVANPGGELGVDTLDGLAAPTGLQPRAQRRVPVGRHALRHARDDSRVRAGAARGQRRGGRRGGPPRLARRPRVDGPPRR